MSKFVRVEGVEIGIESGSGLAVSVYFPDLGDAVDDAAHRWVPLSQVNSMRRDRATHNNDMIEVASWWLRKEGLL